MRRGLVIAAVAAGLGVSAFPPSAVACVTVGPAAIDCPERSRTTADRDVRPPRDAGTENDFLKAANRERARRGLPTLRADARAARIAAGHARAMARSGGIYHNRALSTRESFRALGWPAMIGENVGVGPGVAALHQGFMRSARHRANLLDRNYRRAGVGTAYARNRMFVVQVFLKPGSPPRAAGAGLSRPEADRDPVRVEQAAPLIQEALPVAEVPRPLNRKRSTAGGIAPFLLGGVVLAWVVERAQARRRAF